MFATGLSHPLSLVFDNRGNLYVGQQATPYIAEFNPSGENVANIGPVATGETGDDWIDLASDQCTIFYTTETNVIYRYNKCTNTQLSPFISVALSGERAFEVRIMSSGDVLVARLEVPVRRARPERQSDHLIPLLVLLRVRRWALRSGTSS